MGAVSLWNSLNPGGAGQDQPLDKPPGTADKSAINGEFTLRWSNHPFVRKRIIFSDPFNCLDFQSPQLFAHTINPYPVVCFFLFRESISKRRLRYIVHLTSISNPIFLFFYLFISS